MFVTEGVHSQELTWKWRMAPWKTIFHYKQVVFHFHVCYRRGTLHLLNMAVYEQTVSVYEQADCCWEGKNHRSVPSNS